VYIITVVKQRMGAAAGVRNERWRTIGKFIQSPDSHSIIQELQNEKTISGTMVINRNVVYDKLPE